MAGKRRPWVARVLEMIDLGCLYRLLVVVPSHQQLNNLEAEIQREIATSFTLHANSVSRQVESGNRSS